MAVVALLWSASAHAEVPALKLCTGKAGWNYKKAGEAIARKLEGKVKVEVVESAGSWENLEGLSQSPRRCDAALAQDDAYALWHFEKPETNLSIERVTSLYDEHAYLLCNEKAGIGSLKDLDPEKHKVMIRPFGTGSYITWKLFSKLDGKLAKVPAPEAGEPESLLKVVDGVAAHCMFFVSGPGNDFAKQTGEKFGDKLELVKVRDKNLLRKVGRDKRSVYSNVEVDEDAFPKLLDDDLETVSVAAVFFISPEWKADNPKAAAALNQALVELVPEIKKLVE
jgi:TRAP-type uncharacterized transport system substrate-binding protein